MTGKAPHKAEQKKRKIFKDKHPEGRKAYANAKNGHKRGFKKVK